MTRPRFVNFMPRAKLPANKKRAVASPEEKTVADAAENSPAALAARPVLHIGIAVAAVVFVLDQLTKYAVLYGLDLAVRGKIYVTPFMDFVLAMNRGISYGLFPQDGELGRWFLFSVKIAASVFFFLWMRRATSGLVAIALGLLIGGALGNALDRALQGAVVDFVALHAFGFRWYVFNLADAAIVAGVIGLLYDALRPSALKSPPKGGI